MEMQTFSQGTEFNSFAYILQIGIAGTYDNSIFLSF
jgi:hypothetical protein